MEEWGYIDERDLQNWKGGVVCITCQHFTYGVDQHCHTMVGCNLRQKQLQQGEHLKKRCKLWASTCVGTLLSSCGRSCVVLAGNP